jgi:hypothetical protein
MGNRVEKREDRIERRIEEGGDKKITKREEKRIENGRCKRKRERRKQNITRSSRKI